MAKKSSSDILTIHNIDVNCSESQIEYRRKIITGLDEDGNHVSDSQDVPYGFDHKDGFQTMYEGEVFGIRPGSTRQLPRYIGEKYTKELVDHLLTKKSKISGDPNIVNDVTERTILIDQIIINEDILVQEGGFSPMKDNMDNPDNSSHSKILKGDEVEVSDSLRGFEVEKKPTITLEDVKNAPEDTITEKDKDGNDKKYTRAELMVECKQLGLPVKNTDTSRDLLSKIRAF